MADFTIRLMGKPLEEINIDKLNELTDKGYILWTNNLNSSDRLIKAISLETLKEFIKKR